MSAGSCTAVAVRALARFGKSRYPLTMLQPVKDPLTYWTRVFLVLGLVLLVLAVVPAVIDFTLLNGSLVVVAIIALSALGPLAVLFVVIGAILWVIGKLRR